MELSIKSTCQYVTWRVRDFFQLPSEIRYYLDSPGFRFNDGSYCLRLYPNGTRRYRNGAQTELCVVRLNSTFPEGNVSCKVGYSWTNVQGSKIERYSKSSALINKLHLRRSTLQKYRDKYVPDGIFTALCSMRLEEQQCSSTLCCAGNSQSEELETSDTEEEQRGLPGTPDSVSCAVQTKILYSISCAVQTEISDSVIDKENLKNDDWSTLDTKGVALLSERMKELLIKGIEHDVTICVQNKEFRAHRNIISARSPVFAMMLTHDTKENNTSTINIEDCDPESFDEFLLYVYSGRTENLTPSNALQLYYTADKYDFPVLKERCVNMLKTSLSVSSICDVVLFATKHQETELLEVATEFFSQNIKEILVTVGWLNFMSQNPVEANELYIKSVETLLQRK